MKRNDITLVRRGLGLTTAMLLGVVLGWIPACTDRTQTDDEQCFYEDPGYWVKSSTRWCDDIGRDTPDHPEGTTGIGVIVRLPPNEDGTCELCMPPELDDDFIAEAKEANNATGCSPEGTEVVRIIRQCVSPPEQVEVASSGSDCWYRASVSYICHDEV